MAKKPSIELKWNGKSSTIIKNLGFTKEMNKEFADIVLKHADKYTPFSNADYFGYKGHMAQMVYTKALKDDSAIIVYTKPYSKYQYNNPNYEHDHSKQEKSKNPMNVHDKATHHWVEYAWGVEKREITQEASKARKKYRKFKY